MITLDVNHTTRYYAPVIKSFKCADTEALSKGRRVKRFAKIESVARRKLRQLQIAGPFMDDGDWRGIFILDVPDRAAAEAMCNDDPAVKAGRLVCEIHPWLSQVGATLK